MHHIINDKTSLILKFCNVIKDRRKENLLYFMYLDTWMLLQSIHHKGGRIYTLISANCKMPSLSTIKAQIHLG